ncbi:MAG: hypothetical protein GY749_03690 [Desulfobacteraceae bacterium]|nr:hypothetical protein [Desulfobacteraceae bacterium]
MQYTIRGKGKISLSQNNFIFQGGEGKVYGKGKTAYKIYDDMKKLIPEAKIRELDIISNPNVIKPEEIILDKKNKYIGFTMKWIKQSIPMAKLFTNDFRNRNSISDDIILELIETIKEIILSIHQAKCLIVDGNEFNYLVDDKTFKTPFLIDVNTYQTPSFPPTAIMPSIRDPHSKTFTEQTDWYSFGIVACQLFAGIHPFKGKHPDYTRKIMGNNLLLNRMKDNISVFNSNVSVPPAARDFSCIPKNYMNWFVDLFEKGKRMPPPMTAGSVVTGSVGVKIIQSTNNFEIKLLKNFESEILYHYTVYGTEVTKTREKLYIGNTAYQSTPDTEVVFTPQKAKPVLVSVKNNMIQFSDIHETQGQIRSLPIECTEKMITCNTLFVRNQGDLIEVALTDMENGDIMPAVKSVWKIMPNASEIFDGVIFQSVLGKPHLAIPLPASHGLSSCINLHIPELEGCRVISAKHENRVCILVVYREDIYCRMVFKFDESYKKYDCRITEDIRPDAVNFVVLDNGIAISLNDDNAIEVFINKMGNYRTDIIKDPDIRYSMKLCRDGIITKFFREKGLYSIRRITN